MSVCGGGPKFTTLNGMDLSRTLARRLISTVDNLRDLMTRFGLRPYEVRMVRTKWSGGERGLGQEFVVFDEPILPTPLILGMDGITRIVQPVGLDEVGGCQLSQVSGRYAEGYLTGRDSEGNPVDGDTQYYFEVVFPTPGEVADGAPRRRFYASSAPLYDPSNFEWRVSLQRSHSDRRNDGSPY